MDFKICKWLCLRDQASFIKKIDEIFSKKFIHFWPYDLWTTISLSEKKTKEQLQYTEIIFWNKLNWQKVVFKITSLVSPYWYFAIKLKHFSKMVELIWFSKDSFLGIKMCLTPTSKQTDVSSFSLFYKTTTNRESLCWMETLPMNSPEKI